MTFKVLNPGMFSTIQDLGRKGHQSEGFSQAGAVDYLSHMTANQLIGNEPDAATLEMTFQGAVLKVLDDTVIATAGSTMDITINSKVYTSGSVLQVVKGDEITFGSCLSGTRVYLSVPGGFDIPQILGSRSTHTRSGIGGFQGRTLKTGDILESSGGESILSYQQALPVDADDTDDRIRIIPGQQFHLFTKESRKKLFESRYEVTKDSDRMGIRLKGDIIKSKGGNDVLSEPTQLGSIQVPKNGQPIILLNDRQTAGGYTRIATIALCDIPKIAQLKTGSEITFIETSVEEALEAYKSLMKDILDGKYITGTGDFSNVRRIPAEKITKLMGE